MFITSPNRAFWVFFTIMAISSGIMFESVPIWVGPIWGGIIGLFSTPVYHWIRTPDIETTIASVKEIQTVLDSILVRPVMDTSSLNSGVHREQNR